MVGFTIRLDDQLAARMRTAAKRSGRGLSEFTREALGLHLDATDPKESLLQKAKRLGVVGVVKGLPPDLSTNKKYFEGFGKRSGSDSTS